MFSSRVNATMNAEKSLWIYLTFVMVVHKWLMVGFCPTYPM